MDEKTINWQKVILYALAIQAGLILILLYLAFGFAVTYGLILIILIMSTVLFSYIALKQTRTVRAAEVALQYVFDRIDGLTLEIDHEIKQMVWAEDVPEVRRVVELMHQARKELMNAPTLFNGTVIEEIYAPPEEELETEEQLREALKGQLNETALKMLTEELLELRKDNA